MKKLRLIPLLLCFLLLCSSAGCGRISQEEEQLHITATTYPLYVLTSAIMAGSDHAEVRRLNTGSVSCLHDYTLTVSDMRYLEQADVLIMNGAELETFLDSALSQLSAIQIDCSLSIELMEGDSHEHHHEEEDDHAPGHTHEHDAHYWMDPRNMISAAKGITHTLSEVDPAHAALYTANCETVCTALQAAYDGWYSEVCDLSCPYLITFHDGFYYFAEAFDLEILFSMEEEDGATASAKDILTAANFVKEYHLPAVFTEINGSGAAARAVSGETGAGVFQLSMLMSGDDVPSSADAETIIQTLYISPMNDNIKTLSEVLK